MVIRYSRWMENKGYDPNNTRWIKGTYRNEGSMVKNSGDNFECIIVDNNAEKSYKMALQYYNETKVNPKDKSRLYVNAQWINIK